MTKIPEEQTKLSHAQTPVPKPIIKKKITDIVLVPYGYNLPDGIQIDCEPTHSEIVQAIDTGKLESRDYQKDIKALMAEWMEKSHGDFNAACQLER